MSGEQIISPFQEFLERREAWQYYVVSVATVAIGVVLDAFWPAGNWTPRFGALIAAGVAFCYFSDLRQHESWWRWLRSNTDEKIEDAEAPLRDALSESRMMSALGSSSTDARAHSNDAFLRTRQPVKALRQEYWGNWGKARKALTAQGVCALFGTLVWAFGDLPVSLVHCGALKC